MRGRSTTAAVGALGAAVVIAGCGEPEWRRDREPVVATSYGGAIGQDIAIRHDQPMRTIYEPAPDLSLGPDSAAAFGTPADSVNPRAGAATTAVTPGGGGSVRDTLAVERTRVDTLPPSVRDTSARGDTTGGSLDTTRDTLRSVAAWRTHRVGPPTRWAVNSGSHDGI
jgi:hypothetical protein